MIVVDAITPLLCALDTSQEYQRCMEVFARHLYALRMLGVCILVVNYEGSAGQPSLGARAPYLFDASIHMEMGGMRVVKLKNGLGPMSARVGLLEV